MTSQRQEVADRIARPLVHEDLDRILVDYICSDDSNRNKEALWALWGGRFAFQTLRKLAPNCTDAFPSITPHKAGVERRIVRFLEQRGLMTEAEVAQKERSLLFCEVRDLLEEKIYNPESLKKAVEDFDPEQGPLTHWLWTRSFHQLRDWWKSNRSRLLVASGTLPQTTDGEDGTQEIQDGRVARPQPEPVSFDGMSRRQHACSAIRFLPRSPLTAQCEQVVIEEASNNIPKGERDQLVSREPERCLSMVAELEVAIQFKSEEQVVQQYVKEEQNGRGWENKCSNYQVHADHWQKVLQQCHGLTPGETHGIEVQAEDMTQAEIKLKWSKKTPLEFAMRQYALSVRQAYKARCYADASHESRAKKEIVPMFRPTVTGEWAFVSYARYPTQTEIGDILRLNVATISRTFTELKALLQSSQT